MIITKNEFNSRLLSLIDQLNQQSELQIQCTIRECFTKYTEYAIELCGGMAIGDLKFNVPTKCQYLYLKWDGNSVLLSSYYGDRKRYTVHLFPVEDANHFTLSYQLLSRVLDSFTKETTFKIPDPNFARMLNLLYPEIMSEDELIVDKASKIRFLPCDNRSIESLDGIQYFHNLTHLFCCENSLTSLDLSANPKLATLSCSANKLTKLDVSNSNIQYLDCRDNYLEEVLLPYWGLASLRTSGNPKHLTLSVSNKNL